MTVKILDDRFHSTIMAKGSLGLGEAYMNGWWDVERLDLFFNKHPHTDLNY